MNRINKLLILLVRGLLKILQSRPSLAKLRATANHDRSIHIVPNNTNINQTHILKRESGNKLPWLISQRGQGRERAPSMAFQDFDLIQQRRHEEKKQKSKQNLVVAFVISVITILLLAAAVCFAIYKTNKNNHHHALAARSQAAPPPPRPKSTQSVVKSVCANTDYKKTCEESILREVKTKNNATATPMDILRASLIATSKVIDDVTKQAKGLQFEPPMKKSALNNCLVLLKDGRDEVNSSIASVRGARVGRMKTAKAELDNWLSAVISYQQTCLDGFPEGAEKDKMKKILESVMIFGSNALSVVSQVSDVQTEVETSNGSRRKLLGFGWANSNRYRRILKSTGPKFTPNVTVAKDKTGNFTTINESLKAMPKKFRGRYIIYVKGGVYEETVVIAKEMENVTLYGDGSQKTIITGSKNFVDGVTTFETATFVAIGARFMAQSLGFSNTAGPEKHQAVALRVQSDRSIFVNCRIEGYKSTLYVQAHRQFYRNCHITGTVDFIFGDAAAVFQNCMIYLRKPLESQQNVVTAQGRAERRETTGFVLQNCKILADEKLEPEKAKVKSFLGRPWKEYSRTIVMESEIGDVIQPEGWKEWNGDLGLKTLFYAEYNNKGAGASTKDRVKWGGYKTLKRDDVLKFTVGPFLQAEDWLKAADVPVRFGMFS